MNEQPFHARITRLHFEEGYGFLETLDGRELRFLRTHVANDGFAQLTIGTEVLVTKAQGRKGATDISIQIVRDTRQPLPR